MADDLTLVRDRWYGWQSLPRSAKDDPLWSCTPALVCEVTPLKTGQGRLRVDFIKAINPGGAVRQTADFEVLQRDAQSLVVRHGTNRGGKSIGIFGAISFGWMENYCSRFWSRFPGDNTHAWPATFFEDRFSNCAEYLAEAFGRDPDAVLHGVTKESFQGEKTPMPRKNATLRLGHTYDPFDSYLISRGFRPRGSDDRWFIHLEGDRLLFRRSWSGNVIFEAETAWRGACLHLGEVKVNRDPAQYGTTDDRQDLDMLGWLIDSHLCGRQVEPPALDARAAAG